VHQALRERVYRSDRIAAKVRELIEEGTLRISVDGSRVGQVNGLSVWDLGDYRFGRPSRVTASVGVGREGLVNIERESDLSGSTHDKGVLILEGYLRNRYARVHPLVLSASLTFEQSYGWIEGDSASSAELYCLLSALADVPLRQDIAVTGSVNQHGEVSARASFTFAPWTQSTRGSNCSAACRRVTWTRRRLFTTSSTSGCRRSWACSRSSPPSRQRPACA
jgi:predicted ATP-dependent protease